MDVQNIYIPYFAFYPHFYVLRFCRYIYFFFIKHKLLTYLCMNVILFVWFYGIDNGIEFIAVVICVYWYSFCDIFSDLLLWIRSDLIKLYYNGNCHEFLCFFSQLIAKSKKIVILWYFNCIYFALNLEKYLLH